MNLNVRYEWDVETVTTKETDQYEAGEILDHHHTLSYKEALKYASEDPGDGTRYDIVLVRDAADCRSWAYVENGKLPSHFSDAYGNYTAKVPQRFHREVARK